MTKREREARERLWKAVIGLITTQGFGAFEYDRALAALLRVVREEARRAPR